MGPSALASTERRFEAIEPDIDAFLPEDGRFDRLRREWDALVRRYPDPGARPPLFGLLAGVKDIFHVDGCQTRAGSRLPPDVLGGDEGDAVSRLKQAGALIAGKTVTTEFAHFQPGPTRNPRNLAHTPGGSSSGSAAAVAAELCDVALGTQTIGSIIRPASFCGIVGLKPTFDRISTRGVIPLSPSFDTVGVFARDVETARRAARVLYAGWHDAEPGDRPTLGIPAGPYLELPDAGTREWFDAVRRTLTDAGYTLREVPVMPDFAAIRARHELIVAAEAARTHARWFRDHEALYGPKTASLIRRGQAVGDDELQTALTARDAFREQLGAVMVASGIDAWICPAALGPAPRGLDSTGDPVMSLPWTQAGLPAVAVPAGRISSLPMGLQIIGRLHADERLLAAASRVLPVLSAAPPGQSPSAGI